MIAKMKYVKEIIREQLFMNPISFRYLRGSWISSQENNEKT